MTKKLAMTLKQLTEVDHSKEEMRCELEELKLSLTRVEEQLQQSSNIKTETERLKAENGTFRNKVEEFNLFHPQ